MLDKIPGWTPEYYNASELPGRMPQDLQNHIENLGRSKPQEVGFFQAIQYPKITKTFLLQLKTIWVSCHGENPADVDNIGRISYYPRRGFPGYFFPYQNQEGYLSPLVALHFERPACKYQNSVRNLSKKTGHFWAEKVPKIRAHNLRI
jgi:sodium/potassium-transporting ATPase subunit beta